MEHTKIKPTNILNASDADFIEDLVKCWNSHDELVAALEAWQKYDSEHPRNHPCPDLTLRVHYCEQARKLTEQALAKM